MKLILQISKVRCTQIVVISSALLHSENTFYNSINSVHSPMGETNVHGSSWSWRALLVAASVSWTRILTQFHSISNSWSLDSESIFSNRFSEPDSLASTKSLSSGLACIDNNAGWGDTICVEGRIKRKCCSKRNCVCIHSNMQGGPSRKMPRFELYNTTNKICGSGLAPSWLLQGHSSQITVQWPS